MGRGDLGEHQRDRGFGGLLGSMEGNLRRGAPHQFLNLTRELRDGRIRGLADPRTRGLQDLGTRGLGDSRTVGLGDFGTRGMT